MTATIKNIIYFLLGVIMSIFQTYIEQKNAGVNIKTIINHIDFIINNNELDSMNLIELNSIKYQFEKELISNESKLENKI